MDRLRALEAFVAVADVSGFTPAAARLRISPTAVSRLVAELEDRMGIRLFARTTRTVRLTEAGAQFVVSARKILSDLTDAEAAVAGTNQSLVGRITLTAPVLFGRNHVAPAVLEFMRAYPDITIDLRLQDHVTDLLEENIDIAVRIAELSDASLTRIRVGSVGRVLCASPEYVDRRGLPRSLNDLKEHDGIELESASSRQWIFRQGGRDRAVRPKIVLSVNSPEVVISAALQGLGVARFMTYQVREEMRAGRLRPLLTRNDGPAQPVHIAYNSRKHLSRRIRVLLDFLKPILRNRLAKLAPSL